MKSLAEIYDNGNGLAVKAQPVDRKTYVINEIEKQFNQIFIELKAVFPAITAVIKTQSDLDTFKKQWLLSFAENGITTLRQFEIGMKKARQQSTPFVPSPGQFISWCKEGEASDMGLPTVAQVMREFNKYSAEIGFSCQTAEQFPWSHPVMYWIVTDLRKHMRQYNQSEFEVEKRAEMLINRWAKKLSNGEVIPEIRVQLEEKKPGYGVYYCNSDAVNAMRERAREKAKRSIAENG
ncbi:MULTISPECIES: replication protein P [unclassified Gilliamella]|uniref:replication protein P n=1 Tax=unclassified Gilliamella TaxID=2685620 RepID=UPI0013098A9D|nr:MULTISPECIES: replication protein P [unclassified Gilliamella]MWP48563.1 DNA replication protein [Gilliamella sp. Lep-s35]MWP68625.1 DNA replication protein [Gilliamella sp. Lep-s5]MWP76707.1 DNA replication protein [Gilliamella sp. Lep-s21]